MKQYSGKAVPKSTTIKGDLLEDVMNEVTNPENGFKNKLSEFTEFAFKLALDSLNETRAQKRSADLAEAMNNPALMGNMTRKLHLITTGGTIQGVLEPGNDEIIRSELNLVKERWQKNIVGAYTIDQTEVCNKFSRDLNDDDRALIVQEVKRSACDSIVVMHNLPTLPETYEYLYKNLSSDDIGRKRIVISGSRSPIEENYQSDALHNMGACEQVAFHWEPGIYCVANGRLFNATREKIKVIEGPGKCYFEHAGMRA